VGKMLRRVEVRVLAELSERVKAEKAVQHESYEVVKRTAWQEWERSRRNAVMVRTKSSAIEADRGRGKVDLPAEEVTRTVKGRLGDPRYLAEVRAAMDAQAKLWGLYAAPTDPPPDQGAADPEVARRALLAAGADVDPPDEEDDDAEYESDRE
jgi:hypothetical protein